jgi:hypothetical protein
MEYPKLHQTESDKLDKEVKRRARLQAQIEKDRKIYAKFLQTAERKGDAFALYEAYIEDEPNESDDKPEDKTESEPQIAQAIWEDESLGLIQQRLEKKSGQISAEETRLKQLGSHVESHRGLVKAVAMYNPSAMQARNEVVQKYFYFASGDNWLWANRARRRQQKKPTNSRFKTFQDIFARHNYRIVPKSEGSFGNTDFDELSLDPVVMDPERISDAFLKELENRDAGLYLPSEEKHPLDRLREKEGMIPPVKRFFQENVSPVHKVSWESNNVNYRVLAVKGYHPDHDGKLICPHFDTSEDAGKRHKIMAIYPSAYTARRHASRIFAQYGRESDTLLGIKWQVTQVRKTLEGGVSSDQASVLEKARMQLCETIEKLKKPKNLKKVSARDRLLSASQLTDIRGRLNVGASLAKLVAVCGDIQARLEEVDDTCLAGPDDYTTLNAVILQSSNVLNAYSGAFQQYIATQDKKAFAPLQHTLQKLDVRPFNLYAKRLMDCLGAMNHNDDIGIKIAEATKAFAVTRLFDVQRKVERLISECDLKPDSVPAKLQGVLSEIDGLQVSGYEAPFARIKGHLSSLSVQSDIGLLKNGLKEIDFEELLKQIAE